ncbi:MAG: RraA family protein [Candidatus Solibacter sp.]
METTQTGAASVPLDLRGACLLDFVGLHLYTAVLSDALDEMGVRNQAMREYLRPIHAGCRFAGWAHTIGCEDVFENTPNPYDNEIAAVDSILPDEVVVVSTGRSVRNAPWGELLSTAAVARGARGAVVDGLVRDVEKINLLGFPLFASGMKPVDSLGRGIVTSNNESVECGEVTVHPGDLVVADMDGIVVVPAARVGDAVRLAAEKAMREDGSRAELRGGAYLRDVYRKYGVL